MSSEIGRLLTFEPARAKGNAVVVLAIVAILLFFVMIGLYIGRYSEEIVEFSRQAELLAEGARNDPEGVLILGLINENTDPAIKTLFREHSPLLALFFWIAAWGMPFLTLLLASDQTSSELGRKHIRFLLPRASRGSIYLSRALSSWLIWVLLCAVTLFPIGTVLVALDPSGQTGSMLLVLRMTLVLALYGMPFVAFMAFINSFIPNAYLAYLTATGICTVVVMFAAIGSWVDEGYKYFGYLLPMSVKYPLMSGEMSRLLSGAGGAFVYSGIYIALGAWIFRSRDM